MKFSLATVAFAFAASVAAAPHMNPRWPVPHDMTIQQARDTCGKAKLNCCDKVEANHGDSNSNDNGLIAGVLGHLISNNGAGSEGLALFNQCSDLGVGVIGAADLLKKKCQTNAACCQDSPSTAVSTPCYRPFMVLLTNNRKTGLSMLVCPALLSALFSKRVVRFPASY